MSFRMWVGPPDPEFIAKSGDDMVAVTENGAEPMVELTDHVEGWSFGPADASGAPSLASVVDPKYCPHEETEPVEVRDRTTGGTTVVARICRGCLAQLEAGWGCPACEWDTYEERMLCEPRPTVHHVLIRPCKEHA